MDVNRALRTAAQTGTVNLGFESSLKAVLGKKAKLVVLADNAPETAVAQIDAAARKSGVPVYKYSGKNTELGPACGKPFSVSVLTVVEAGDSDVLQLAKGA